MYINISNSLSHSCFLTCRRSHRGSFNLLILHHELLEEEVDVDYTQYFWGFALEYISYHFAALVLGWNVEMQGIKLHVFAKLLDHNLN